MFSVGRFSSLRAARNYDVFEGGAVFVGRKTDGRTRGATAHACGPALDVAAQIALHRDRSFDLFLLFLKERGHPADERAVGFLVNHEDVAVRTIALTVAAADAVALDVDLAAGVARDRVGGAVEHAERVFALPAGVRREKVVELDAGEG